MTWGKPSEMPKEPTETNWSLTTTAPTPDTCGVDCDPPLTTKGGIVEQCGASYFKSVMHYLLLITVISK